MKNVITPAIRLGCLLAYAAFLLALQIFYFDKNLVPNESSLWLYSGLFALLISSKLTNPYFTPPIDALVNTFAGILAIASGFAVSTIDYQDEIILKTALIFMSIIFSLCFITVCYKNLFPHVTNVFFETFERASKQLGDAKVVFTFVIILSAWIFHLSAPKEIFWILTSWCIIAFLSPIESFIAFYIYSKINLSNSSLDYIGVITAYQLPKIALVRLNNSTIIQEKQIILLIDQEGRKLLGLMLNKVGKDEGVLIKVLMLEVPTNINEFIPSVPKNLNNLAFSISLTEDQLNEIPQNEEAYILNRTSSLCGIVDQDTSISTLQFEVVDDTNITEGRLAETMIGNQKVMYQIVDGLTREDIVQQKDKYGYARGKARKIGIWNVEKKTFVPVSWLPRINSAVFLSDSKETRVVPEAVGCIPNTDFHIGINISEAVTHNTAILGILGVGKSCLSLELVERMINADIKVISLDLTNQYRNELKPILDEAYIDDAYKRINPTDRGTSDTDKSKAGNAGKFRTDLHKEIKDFMQSDKNILIFNPANFNVWKQSREKFKETDTVPLEPVSAAEITAYFSMNSLSVCEELGMTDKARLCLVYEEAHSLVPEWNSVAQDGDKYATSITSRAILQGRKFGLGCLLITQRTANVTKTILNQCNTIFAMRTFDDTGKDFLSNYIGSDYAQSLAGMKARHAVFYGKASTCENPVLLSLNDRSEFLKSYRKPSDPKQDNLKAA